MINRFVLNIDDLGPAVRHTGTGETIFVCPFCPTNDPDESGHLYVNQVKGVGECKRCNAVIVVKENKPHLMQRFVDFLAGKPDEDEEGGEDIGIGVRIFDLEKTIMAMGYRPVHRNFAHAYLSDRHIPGEIAAEAHVFYNPKTQELLFPFINPFTLDTFSGWAIRRTGGGGTWTNTKAAKKNLYLPSHKVSSSKYLIVVEGVADALSLYARGYPAVALCGSSISPLQTKQLLLRMPEHIDLLLDKDAQAAGISLAASLRNTCRNSSRNCKIVFVECPVKDPAVMSWEDLAEVLGGDFEPPLGTYFNNLSVKLSDLDKKEKPKGNGVDKERSDLEGSDLEEEPGYL